MRLGDEEPDLLAAFLEFAESLPPLSPLTAAAVPSEPAPQPPRLRNSTPEERIAFFGLG